MCFSKGRLYNSCYYCLQIMSNFQKLSDTLNSMLLTFYRLSNINSLETLHPYFSLHVPTCMYVLKFQKNLGSCIGWPQRRPAPPRKGGSWVPGQGQGTMAHGTHNRSAPQDRANGPNNTGQNDHQRQRGMSTKTDAELK